MSYRGPNAIVVTLHVHSEDSIKIFLGGSFDVAYLRDPGIVDENMHVAAVSKFIQQFLYIGLLRNIANMSTGATVGFGNFSHHRRRVALVEIENADRGARCRESQGGCPPDAASTAGDDSGFTVETELS